MSFRAIRILSKTSDKQHIINNKARKAIIEQGFCTDIYDKKGVLIYDSFGKMNRCSGGGTAQIPWFSSGERQKLELQKNEENSEYEFTLNYNQSHCFTQIVNDNSFHYEIY